MERKLLNSKQVCERLHVGPTWLGHEMWRVQNGKSKPGSLPPLMKVGGRYLCYEDELNEWLESQKVVSP